MEYTQLEKALAMLIRRGDWLSTIDFTRETEGLFIGYKGQARVSELARAYPEVIETDKTAKIHRYCFKSENTLVGLETLPDGLKTLAKEEIKRRGGSYLEEYTDYERIDDSTVRKVLKVRAV